MITESLSACCLWALFSNLKFVPVSLANFYLLNYSYITIYVFLYSIYV